MMRMILCTFNPLSRAMWIFIHSGWVRDTVSVRVILFGLRFMGKNTYCTGGQHARACPIYWIESSQTMTVLRLVDSLTLTLQTNPTQPSRLQDYLWTTAIS